MMTTDHIHIGIPPHGLDFDKLHESLMVEKRFFFHNFLNLSAEKGYKVESPSFDAFGHQWKIKVYPGGDGTTVNCISDTLVTFRIEHCSHSSIDVFLTITPGTLDMSNLKSYWRSASFTGKGNESVRCVRNDVIICLSNGTLPICLRMFLKTATYSRDIMPKSNLAEGMVKVFRDEDFSDVAFDVKGEIFFSHKIILKAQAKELFIMCESFDKEKPLPVDDVEPEVFGKMLGTLYGDRITSEEWSSHYKDILKAACKWGFGSLKLEADARYAANICFASDENAMEELAFAIANHCPMLKKAAGSFIAEN